MVQPRLADAMTKHSVTCMLHLIHYKQRGGKMAKEKIQTERQTTGSEPQSSLPVVSFSNWLPSFYDELLLYLEQEWKWSMKALPDDYTALVPRMLIETMAALQSIFVSRINLAIDEAVQKQKLGQKVVSVQNDDISERYSKGIDTALLYYLQTNETQACSFKRAIKDPELTKCQSLERMQDGNQLWILLMVKLPSAECTSWSSKTVLEKNYEKLVKADSHLASLRGQPFPSNLEALFPSEQQQSDHHQSQSVPYNIRHPILVP